MPNSIQYGAVSGISIVEIRADSGFKVSKVVSATLRAGLPLARSCDYLLKLSNLVTSCYVVEVSRTDIPNALKRGIA